MTAGLTSDFESLIKRFQPFEFNSDEAAIEKQSTRMLAKFRNLRKPRNTKENHHDSPISKYNFLQCFTKHLPKEFSKEPIDVDAGVEQGARTPEKEITNSVLDDDASTSGHQGGLSATFRVGTLAVDGASTRLDACDRSSSSNHQKKQVCTISDDGDRIEMLSASTLAYRPSKNEAPLEEQASDLGSGRYEIVGKDIGDLHLDSQNNGEAGSANKTSEQEGINSLDVRDGVIRNLEFDFGTTFEDVIYPPGDPDAVCICKRDLELLQPETFINDTIVDFYIKYLQSQVPPRENHRFYFFNSFFFRKIDDLKKHQSTSSEGKEALQRVLKWTRKVNIFENDYIFIPVNFRLHWSLIVICHPGEMANVQDEEIESCPKVPCILHMDSIKGSHRGLRNLVRRYLCEEWKEKHREMADDCSLKFLRLRFFALELPQQENSFDCGLFLLHYVERFLEEAPLEFNPSKTTKFSNFIKRNWFPPKDASVKRFQIKKLIYEIFRDQSGEAVIADCVDKHPSSQVPNKTDEQETGIKFLDKMPSSTKNNPGNSSSSSSIGMRIPLFRASPTVKETEETGDEITHSSVNMEDGQKGTGLASEFLPISKELRTSDKYRFPKDNDYNADGNSTSQTSDSGSQNSSAVEEIGEDCASKDFTCCVVLDSEEEGDTQANKVKYLSSSLKNRFHTESAEQQAPKRLRLTKSLMRKLHL